MGGRFVPAVLSFDLADFYSRALGPFAIKICRHLHSNVHRLVRPYLFGAAMVGHPATAQPPQFYRTRRYSFSAECCQFQPGQAPVGRGKEEARSCFRSRRTQVSIFQEGVPRKWGPGKGDYERPLRVGAHRSRPRRRFGYFAAVGKVTFSPWKAKRNARACPGVSHRKPDYSIATACCRTIYRGSKTSAEIQ